MRGQSKRPKWEAKVRGHVRGCVRGHVRGHVRGCVRGHVGGHLRGHGSPRWEAASATSASHSLPPQPPTLASRGGGRPCEFEVGGCARPKWEAKVGGCGRLKWPMWEAVGVRGGRPI